MLRTEAEREQWLSAPISEVEAIQSRLLLSDELEIVSDDEAAQFAGGYIK